MTRGAILAPSRLPRLMALRLIAIEAQKNMDHSVMNDNRVSNNNPKPKRVAPNNNRGETTTRTSAPRPPRLTAVAPPLVPCSECGHLVPETNLDVHRATCHHSQHHYHFQEEMTRDDEEQQQEEETSTSPSSVPTVVRCEKCGRNIPSTNLMVHTAYCHKEEEKEKESLPQSENSIASSRLEPRNSSRDDVVIPPQVQVINDEHGEDMEVTVADRHSRINEREVSSSSSSTSASAETEQQQQWACPQCTLLNPNSSNQCNACLYIRNQQQASDHRSATTTPNNEAQQQLGGVRVQVSEMDPRVVDTIGSASTVLGWGMLGGLIGGPVGALVGGTLGATIDGARRLNNYRLEQAGLPRPRPRFVFTTVSQTPDGATTISTTASGSNNSGWGQEGIQTVRISGTSIDQMTPADRRILQMLVLNAMSQGAPQVDQMSYEELLERFGVGTENRRRGASSEVINRLPLITMDTQQKLDELHENQKCCNICLVDLKIGDRVRKLSCGHVYHQQCIDRWLSQVASCPICKREVEGTTTTTTTSDQPHTSSLPPAAQVRRRAFWS